jgi:hypothetical protein
LLVVLVERIALLVPSDELLNTGAIVLAFPLEGTNKIRCNWQVSLAVFLNDSDPDPDRDRDPDPDPDRDLDPDRDPIVIYDLILIAILVGLLVVVEEILGFVGLETHRSTK